MQVYSSTVLEYRFALFLISNSLNIVLSTALDLESV